MLAAMPTRLVFSLLFCLLSLFMTGCETGSSPASGPQAEARRRQIAMEPRGDYYIGRRFPALRSLTHFWGYLRSPGQDWSSSQARHHE